MTLLQIHEPGQTPNAHESDVDTAIGIDLGTTHSLVAISDNGIPEIIRDESGNLLHPSIVQYLESGEIRTGHCKDVSAGHVISSIKRLMGRGANDVKKISGKSSFDIAEQEGEGMIRLNVGGKKLTPVEISSEILKSLRSIAEKALGTDVKRAVITVPAYFDDAARTATKDAAKLAGLEVLRLINEPTAAALAYGLDKNAEGTYAIYDLGGGTFDITILKMEKGIFQVLSTGGSVEIGGDDFDREIAEICLWKYKNEVKKATELSLKELQNVLSVSRKAKEYLTENSNGEFELDIEGKLFNFTVTREQFEKAAMPYVDATIDLCKQALEDAGISSSEIDGVVLVGGSTRVPLVRKKIQEFFDKEPLSDINPDEVVAKGAALQAEGLTKGSDNLLLDVLPLSLGIETMGGIVEKIIHRNTPIPVAKAQEFTTYKDGQTGISIRVVQGEREMVSQNRSLAQFELKGIPKMVAGSARIRVTFTVDADGLLTVSAKEETTGTEQNIEIKPTYGLTDKEIKDMLYASMQHAKDDMELRLLTEAKVEAEGIIMSVEIAIEKDKSLLDKDSLDEISGNIAKLKEAVNNNNRNEINTSRKKLEDSTEKFAEKRMNKYIGEALKGRDVEEVE